MSLSVFHLPEAEKAQILAYVAKMDVRTAAAQVMQELFKSLAMRYEFSLAGVAEAAESRG